MHKNIPCTLTALGRTGELQGLKSSWLVPPLPNPFPPLPRPVLICFVDEVQTHNVFFPYTINYTPRTLTALQALKGWMVFCYIFHLRLFIYGKQGWRRFQFMNRLYTSHPNSSEGLGGFSLHLSFEIVFLVP